MAHRRFHAGVTSGVSRVVQAGAGRSDRADPELRRAWSRALPVALGLSILAHGLLLALGSLPGRASRTLPGRAGAFVLVALPPEVRVPPPPEPVGRPEPPLVNAIEPDPVRIAAANRLLDPEPEPLPPLRLVAPEQGFRAAISKPDVPPMLENDPVLAMERARFYPEELRRAGVGGRVDLRLYVKPSGRVDDVSVVASSGHPRLDRAAVQIGRRMRFFPALSRDRKVGVWVAQTVCFVVLRRPRRRDEAVACRRPDRGG
jgi:TonB family protein